MSFSWLAPTPLLTKESVAVEPPSFEISKEVLEIALEICKQVRHLEINANRGQPFFELSDSAKAAREVLIHNALHSAMI